MHALFLIAIGVLTPQSPIIEERYEVEFNHVSQRFTQMLFRNRLGEIDDWKMYKPGMFMPNEPGILHFNDQGIERVIRVQQFRETWTDYDPEVVDRKYRHQSLRNTLHKAGKGIPYRPPPKKDKNDN